MHILIWKQHQSEYTAITQGLNDYPKQVNNHVTQFCLPKLKFFCIIPLYKQKWWFTCHQQSYFICCLVLVQCFKTLANMTEKLLTGTLRIKTNWKPPIILSPISFISLQGWVEVRDISVSSIRDFGTNCIGEPPSLRPACAYTQTCQTITHTNIGSRGRLRPKSRPLVLLY